MEPGLPLMTERIPLPQTPSLNIGPTPKNPRTIAPLDLFPLHLPNHADQRPSSRRLTPPSRRAVDGVEPFRPVLKYRLILSSLNSSSTPETGVSSVVTSLTGAAVPNEVVMGSTYGRGTRLAVPRDVLLPSTVHSVLAIDGGASVCFSGRVASAGLPSLLMGPRLCALLSKMSLRICSAMASSWGL